MTPSPLSEMTKALERVEPVAWFMHLWNEADEDVKSDVRWGKPTSDDIERAEHNGHDVEFLYDRTLEDEVDRLRAAMGAEGQQFMQALVDEASTEIQKRKDVEAELQRLRSERDGLRFKVGAVNLSDQQLAEEMAEMQRAFSRRGEHGGSPGEWSYERMGEVATEQQRRAATKSKGQTDE